MQAEREDALAAAKEQTKLLAVMEQVVAEHAAIIRGLQPHTASSEESSMSHCSVSAAKRTTVATFVDQFEPMMPQDGERELLLTHY